MPLLALLAALGAAAAPQETDTVRLKDGSVRRGRIVSETPHEIVLETLFKGSKGEIVGSARSAIRRDRIDSIERASEEDRRRAEERSRRFAERDLRKAELRSRMALEPVRIEGISGFRATGTLTVLESTADPDSVRDMACLLEEIFLAYRNHLGIRRNEGSRVRVYVLSDREEYVRFQTRRYGGAVLNPAHYNSRDNFVVAYNLVQKSEERKVRAEIRRLENLLETLRGNAASESARIQRAAQEIRRRIADLAGEARRVLDLQNAPDLAERERRVNQWEREMRQKLQAEEEALRKELEKVRRAAEADIETSRKVLDHNRQVLVNQNRLMLETLFHEGFHAYAANFLWAGAESEKCPRWLHEGMACYFERSVVEGGELIHGALHPQFVKILQEHLPRAALPRLEDILKGGADLFVVVQPEKGQVDRSTLNYAFCWLMGHALAGRIPPEKFQAYIAEAVGGADPVAAFERLVGKKIPDVEAELRARIREFK